MNVSRYIFVGYADRVLRFQLDRFMLTQARIVEQRAPRFRIAEAW